MRSYHQGEFTPTCPQKYVGKYPIFFRSSWELKVMIKFDTHPNITKWASEAMRIPYYNPVTQKVCDYIPDFIVEYIDALGNKKIEIVEVKPAKETFVESAKTLNNKIALVVNEAKWKSAAQWAQSNGMTFRVMTEQDIYHNPPKRTKTKRKKK